MFNSASSASTLKETYWWMLRLFMMQGALLSLGLLAILRVL